MSFSLSPRLSTTHGTEFELNVAKARSLSDNGPLSSGVSPSDNASGLPRSPKKSVVRHPSSSALCGFRKLQSPEAKARLSVRVPSFRGSQIQQAQKSTTTEWGTLLTIEKSSERLKAVSTNVRDPNRNTSGKDSPVTPRSSCSSPGIPTPLPSPGNRLFKQDSHEPPPPPPRPSSSLLEEESPSEKQEEEDLTIVLNPAEPLPDRNPEVKRTGSEDEKIDYASIVHQAEQSMKKTSPEELLNEDCPTLSPRDKYPSKRPYYDRVIGTVWKEVGKCVTDEQNYYRRKEAKAQNDKQGAVPSLNISKLRSYAEEEEAETASARSYLEKLASLQWKSSSLGLNCRRKSERAVKQGTMRIVSSRPGAIPRLEEKLETERSKPKYTRKEKPFAKTGRTLVEDPIASHKVTTVTAKEQVHTTVQSSSPAPTSKEERYTAVQSSTTSTSAVNFECIGSVQNMKSLRSQPKLPQIVINPKKYEMVTGTLESANRTKFTRQSNRKRDQRPDSPITRKSENRGQNVGLPNREESLSKGSLLSSQTHPNDPLDQFLRPQDKSAIRHELNQGNRLYGRRR